jgi:hypothetical protein
MIVDLVHSEYGDWTGLYVNGSLVMEGYSLDPVDVLSALKMDYTEHIWDAEDSIYKESLPDKLNEVRLSQENV